MPETCQNVKKQDYQGVEGKSIGIEVGIGLSQCKLSFLDIALKPFKNSNEMAIENTVPVVPRNLPACTRNE